MRARTPGGIGLDSVHRRSREASERLARLVDDRRPSEGRLVRRCGHAVAAWFAIGRLPVLAVSSSSSLEGRVIRSSLERQSRLARLLVRGATHVLHVPDVPATYRAGASRKLLRNGSNRAVRLGVTWRSVEAESERADLLSMADRREVDHPMEGYRNARPENRRLLGSRTWMLAEDASSTPLLLAVLALDGEWASLQYFRTLRDGEESSFARYLMMSAVVDRLSENRVRYLASDLSPLRLPLGLGEFQERTGYDLVRVRVRR